MTDNQAERICVALEKIASHLNEYVERCQELQPTEAKRRTVKDVLTGGETFGLRLKLLRNNIGMSQQELATTWGVNQSTVGNWEAGHREPHLDMVRRIAAFFDVTTDFLLGTSDTPDNLLEEDMGHDD